MKVKSLQLKRVTSTALFALLMALFAPSVMFGQDELTVFEGTATCREAPMYVYYFDDYTRAQTVYPATELADMAEFPITAIKFYTTSSNIPYTTVSSFDIYLMEIDETSISEFIDRSNATTVYSGTGEFVATDNGGEITITFSEPYVYQGGNLLFGCDNNTDSGYKEIYFYGQNSSGASISGFNDSGLEYVRPTQRNFIPQTTFLYTPSCRRPRDLAVTFDNSDATLATINWTEAGEATNWVLQIATNVTFTEGLQEYEVSDNPTKDLTGLVPETRYYARVKADCGIEESHWSNVINFRPSNTIPLTLNEGTATNEYVPIYGYYVDEYQKSEFIIPASTEGLVAMTEGIINQMTFYLSTPASDLWENVQFQVFLKEVSTTGFSSDYPGNLFHGTDNATIVYEGPLDGTQPTMVIDFTTNYHYNGGNLLVGVYETTKGSYQRAYFAGNTVIGGSLREKNSSSLESITTGSVEDFLPATTFNYLPSNTPKPANVQAQNISSSGATLSWMAVANNVTSYQYQYKEVDGEWTALESTSSTSVTLNGLTELSSYTFQVKAIYDEGESDFAYTTFITLQNPVIVTAESSYIDDFEGQTCNWVLVNGNLVNHWVQGNGTNNGGQQALYITDNDEGTNSYSTNKSAIVYATKLFTLEEGFYNFAFDWKSNGEIYNGKPYDYLRVALVPASTTLSADINVPEGFSYNTLPSDWIALDGGYQLNNSTEWTTVDENVIEIKNSGDYKVVFVWRNDDVSGTNPPAAIDNFILSQVNCIRPTELDATLITSSTATISWSSDNNNFTLRYKKTIESMWSDAISVIGTTYTIENLEPATEYQVEVVSNCTGFDSTPITLSFSTKCESFMITVGQSVQYQEGFENADFPTDCWENVSSTNGSNTYNWSRNTEANHAGTASAYSGYYGPICLYMPILNIDQDVLYAELSFWSRVTFVDYYTGGTLGNHDGLSIVKISTDNGITWRQLWCPTISEQMSAAATWQRISLNLTNYKNKDILIAFEYQGTDAHGWYIDDVAVTVYDKVFVGGSVDDATAWSNADNWQPEGAPGLEKDVVITAPAVISSSETPATANTIILDNQGSLTIADGGQLQHNNEGVQATAQKTISTYTGEKDNYYLIASPFANDLIVHNTLQTNLVANNYDLYMFDQWYDLEWLNHENSGFTNVFNGIGYLYANSGEEGQTTYTINLSGKLESSNTDKSVNLDYYNSKEFAGWNLVGNPFACKAFIGQDYYRLSEGEVELTPASGEIAPMEGVFVKATATNQAVTFSRNEPEERGNRGILNINVMRKGNRVDLARVRFGTGQDLEKFQLNPNHTKVFIPRSGKDYAVAYSEDKAGEMSLNFKSEENGTYTLDFGNEDVTFDYLHLIDNMTGADIDLLNTPSYSFEAKTTDYESRFKLVFASVCEDAAGDNESFAFFGNGNWIIGNKGEATLQVIDMQGRILSSETISGSCNKAIHAAHGVYMIRLINCENVKTQKIIIE